MNRSSHKNYPLVIGITGASGTVLGLRLLKEVVALGVEVDLILTEKCLQVLSSETDFTYQQHQPRLPQLLNWLGIEESQHALVRQHANTNIGATTASGTYLTRGMVVAPCSMGTLAKIAHGLSDNLLCRSADVSLKEGRPLVLLPRETPINAIHLENMLKLSRLGVHLIPPMLAFYNPQFFSMEGQMNYILGKVLDYLGFEHDLYTRWQGL